MLGVIPGYYNSATGITTTFAPTKSIYLNYGFYDGNLAAGHQTGFSGPRFDGYYFHIGEFGSSYRLGPERKPGNFGVGVWGQTGKLANLVGGTTNGAPGVYLFGAQRLWFRRPGVDNSGISGFYQFGANDSDALHARQYVGGGLTAFGLVPGRPDDSFGLGLNCTWLTPGAYSAHLFYPPWDYNDVPPLRPSQLMFQCYYQMRLAPGWFFQTNLTDIPTPGIPPLTTEHRTTFPNALATTLRLTVLF
jgi:porin